MLTNSKIIIKPVWFYLVFVAVYTTISMHLMTLVILVLPIREDWSKLSFCLDQCRIRSALDRTSIQWPMANLTNNCVSRVETNIKLVEKWLLDWPLTGLCFIMHRAVKIKICLISSRKTWILVLYMTLFLFNIDYHVFDTGWSRQKRRTLWQRGRRFCDSVANESRCVWCRLQERRKEIGETRNESSQRHKVLQLQVAVWPVQVLAQWETKRPSLEQEH